MRPFRTAWRCGGACVAVAMLGAGCRVSGAPATLTMEAPFPRGVWAEVPAGWHVGGDAPERYAFEVDTLVARSGRASGRIEQRPGGGDSLSGGANQAMRADAFRARRVRLVLHVRTEEAVSAMSWMRVDGVQDGELVSFALSNTAGRPTSGTTDWERHEHVVDVPRWAQAIYLGVRTLGGGRIWVDDVTIEAVDESVPSTNRLGTPTVMQEGPVERKLIVAEWTTLPLGLRNGGFEDGPTVRAR